MTFNGFNGFPDNFWAFLLLVMASSLAIVSTHMHDKDLMSFAGTLAVTGAAIAHGKDKKE